MTDDFDMSSLSPQPIDPPLPLGLFGNDASSMPFTNGASHNGGFQAPQASDPPLPLGLFGDNVPSQLSSTNGTSQLAQPVEIPLPLQLLGGTPPNQAPFISVPPQSPAGTRVPPGTDEQNKASNLKFPLRVLVTVWLIFSFILIFTGHFELFLSGIAAYLFARILEYYLARQKK